MSERMTGSLLFKGLNSEQVKVALFFFGGVSGHTLKRTLFARLI